MSVTMEKVDIIEQLKLYPKKMANRIKPMLATITIENYYQFLDMMYHYTFNSGQRLRHAASNALEPEINRLFSELAHEENNHYRLAEVDLHDFNRKPSNAIPNEVTDFDNFWFGIKPHEQNSYLGAMYALENVGQYIQNETIACLTRLGIEFKQARFIIVHLEADLDHGSGLEKLCHQFGEQDTVNLFNGAEKGSQFWIAMHEKVLSN